jgi:UDP-N-acetyl-D-glucosamine dehydrogenase
MVSSNSLESCASGAVVVVGLGKIGLPLAVAVAQSGHSVIGVDVNKEIVDSLNNLVVPSGFNEPKLDLFLKKVGLSGNFKASTDLVAAMENASVVLVIVPLVIDEKMNPQFEILDSVTKTIGANIKVGSTVIYETTLPVSSTRNRFLPILLQNSGLEEEDFFLAFSPERVYVGDFFRTLTSVPKLVGGINPRSTKAAANFYRSFIKFETRSFLDRQNGVWEMENSEAAEFAKLAETTYRDVNIALANTFAMHALDLGLDTNEIIAACNSQPFSHIHNPGIYVGGHCIPVYPHLYTSSHSGAELIHVARQINESMPEYLLGLEALKNQVLNGSKVTVMGVSYREGVKETYHSGTFKLCALLEKAGALVTVVDPKYTNEEMIALGLNPHVEDFESNILIFQIKEETFKSLTREDFPKVELIVDGRGFLQSEKWPNVKIIGFGISKNLTAPVTNLKPE